MSEEFEYDETLEDESMNLENSIALTSSCDDCETACETGIGCRSDECRCSNECDMCEACQSRKQTICATNQSMTYHVGYSLNPGNISYGNPVTKATINAVYDYINTCLAKSDSPEGTVTLSNTLKQSDFAYLRQLAVTFASSVSIGSMDTKVTASNIQNLVSYMNNSVIPNKRCCEAGRIWQNCIDRQTTSGCFNKSAEVL